DEIVVCPGIEPRYTIGNRIPGGEHKNWHPRVFVIAFGGTDTAGDVDAVHAGKHEVENQEIWRIVAYGFERFPAIDDDSDLETFEDQATANETGNCRLVLD